MSFYNFTNIFDNYLYFYYKIDLYLKSLIYNLFNYRVYTIDFILTSVYKNN